LPLLRAAEDTHRTAITLDNLGVTYRQLGNLNEALKQHREALSLLQTVGDQLAEASVLKNIAWIEREQGQLAAARRDIELALTRLEFLRANVTGQETRSSFFATVTDYYELNTDILMRLHAVEPNAGYALAALKSSEQARARSLLEQLNETRADIRQGVNAELPERERTLKQQLTGKLDSLVRILNTKAPEAQKTAAQKEASELTAAYRQVQAEIRQTSPHYAALTQPQPLDAAEIQKLLDDDTLLLEYALGEKASYVWAVTSSSVTSYALAPRADIEKLARQVYEQLAQRPSRNAAPDATLVQTAAAFSRTLLGARAPQLNKKRLVIVAPGILSYLPFAALPHPTTRQPLLAAHEIANLPSASVLAVLRRDTSQRAAAGQTLAIFADPVFEASDPRVAVTKDTTNAQPMMPRRAFLSPTRNGFARLAFSRQEAEAIYAVAARGTVTKATDFDASRAAVTAAQLSQARMLHFATHGLLNNEHPALSGLVFSLVNQQGQPQDGFLRLHEVFNLKLNADLVVLSACETALGQDLKGEGLIGLARGFMYAGAPRVVASLWKVDDLATAELMKLFYRGMLKDGLRPAAALRAAQRELARQPRWAAPYFWAGFVLQGEWK
jgi:CHAT domain-containing protein